MLQGCVNHGHRERHPHERPNASEEIVQPAARPDCVNALRAVESKQGDATATIPTHA